MSKGVVLLSGKRVLIVDDEEELRASLALIFRRRGCIVFEAATGQSAIEVAKGNQLDLVVSDVRMPNGTGIELLEAIRKTNPILPLILLITGYADLTEEEAFRKGANALLAKPLDRSKFLALVEKCLL